ncbi:MAG: hypothetical protein CMF23_04615 [Ignavibacteriae bacterium]|nr:hypothetical protein [Ignavibacteriota bacterium]
MKPEFSSTKKQELAIIQTKIAELEKSISINEEKVSKLENELNEIEPKIDHTKVEILIGNKSEKDLEFLLKESKKVTEKIIETGKVFDMKSHRKALEILRAKEKIAIQDAEKEYYSNLEIEAEQLRIELSSKQINLFEKIKKLNQINTLLFKHKGAELSLNARLTIKRVPKALSVLNFMLKEREDQNNENTLSYLANRLETGEFYFEELPNYTNELKLDL